LGFSPAQAAQSGDQQAAEPDTSRSRDLVFTVPVVYGQRALGDALVQVSLDNTIMFEGESLRRELSIFLNDDGRARLDEVLGADIFVDAVRLSTAGFDVRFDQNRLELVVDRIDGRYRPSGTLGLARDRSAGMHLPTIQPAEFSAFMNFNANLDYENVDGLQKPELYVFGAARYQNVVLELDGAFTDAFDNHYRFYRRSLKAVYDMPDQYRRISAGDLRPDTVPLLRTPYIGGVSIERRRQTFRPFMPASRLGGREIYLDTSATVDVLINGSQYQKMQLEPGRYDLADLPLQFGSNDVQLLIRDAAGREHRSDYDYFFEPLDLEAGDYEYVLSVGALARSLSYEPVYSDKLAAVGYYRKAFSEIFMLGGGVQLAEDRQIFAAEMTLIPQVIPGVFDVQGGISIGDVTGYALRAGYRWRSGGDMENRRQFTLTVDYQSRDYQTLDELFSASASSLNVSGSYTQSFSLRTYGTMGFSYTRQGSGLPSRKAAYAELSHRLNYRLRLTGGVEYGEDVIYRRNFGVRVGLSLMFGQRGRVNADYRSRTESFRGSVSRGGDNNVGSWGYDIGFSDTRGDTSADASLDYLGNRFDARASFFTSGRNFGDIADRQRARLQLGTSLAFADGIFGIGRPIHDSFAVLRPHSSLSDREVITGRSMRANKYEASSGIFGAAVQPNLSSYSTQNIQYDLAGLGTGYDIGDGVARVEPPFHAGYAITVGSDRHVSAVGNLQAGGQPLALATGRLTSIDDEGFEPQPFFTNSAGRFGIMGLAPGKTYIVTFTGTGRTLEITVPKVDDGLYRMGTIEMPEQGE